MIQQKLIDEFGGIINHMSCIYLRDGEKHLRSYFEELKPLDTVIEIGTYQGVSACVLAEYAKKVYTFDIADLELRPKILDFLGVKNVNFRKVREGDNKEETIGKVIKTNNVELCFIDGEHFNGELEIDFNICKSCNKILIHDYATNFRQVFDFVNNLEGYDKDIRDTFVLLTKKVTREEQIENIEAPKKKRVRRKRKSVSTKI